MARLDPRSSGSGVLKTAEVSPACLCLACLPCLCLVAVASRALPHRHIRSLHHYLFSLTSTILYTNNKLEQQQQRLLQTGIQCFMFPPCAFIETFVGVPNMSDGSLDTILSPSSRRSFFHSSSSRSCALLEVRRCSKYV